MAVDSASVPGYERLFFDSSTSFYPAQDYPQLTYHEQEDCTWGDFNGSVDSQFNQSFSNDGIKTSNGKRFPKPDDMKYWVLAAFVLILIRRFVERNIFQPLGRRLGIKDRSHITIDDIPCGIPSAVPSLQNAYSANKKLCQEELQALSKETGLKQREIERWMRRRRACDRPSTLVKFSESSWRFVIYIFSTYIGIASLCDKWWFWDFKRSWEGYPNHELPNELRWYYIYGGGVYISFLLTHFSDAKKKDFWEMFLHHIVTIMLFVLSFNANMTRLGLVTLLIHDCSDVFLEMAKMANYTKRKNLSTAIFVAFTLVWIATRLVIYPYKLLYQAGWLTGLQIVPKHIAYPTFGTLLILFGLHVFWTYFICKVAWAAIKPGPGIERDARSASESSEESDSSSLSDKQAEMLLEELANRHETRRSSRRLSLQCDQSASSFLAKQRIIMRKISTEIM